MNSEMKIKNLKCTLNMPKKLESADPDFVHRLPPYAPVSAYLVDEYPSCPTNWMHGSSISSSYFVGVEEDHGMWIDFNRCFEHEQDVAIVLSIQGVNPITGQKMVGENLLRLEQYKTKCPVHNLDFQQDRYCKECGFKWPAQNYLSTTGTPYGSLWLDGFRSEDGKVRQYIFTSEILKGIAAQIIGEDRVFAIGIAFYLSKEKKPFVSFGGSNSNGKINIPYYPYDPGTPYWGFDHTYYDIYDYNIYDYKIGTTKWNGMINKDTWKPEDLVQKKYASGLNADVTFRGILNSSSNSHQMFSQSLGEVEAQCCFSSMEEVSAVSETPIDVKHLEIGAGSIIQQRVHDDIKDISYWEQSPAGIIYINYTDKKTVDMILKQGKREDKKDGFMNGLNVGSPSSNKHNKKVTRVD